MTAQPRSLAQALRAWPDEDLLALLRLRPDLTVPIPADLSALAGRATQRSSVQRALDDLNLAQWQVLQAIAVAPEPASVKQLDKLWHAGSTIVVAQLRDRALLWGPDDALHLIRTARELIGSYPAGLGPDIADMPTAPEIRAMIAQAPKQATQILEGLTWGPPLAALEDAERAVSATSTNPVEWLLAHRLLTPLDPDRVVLPRQVAMVLREGRLFRRPAPYPPTPMVQPRPTANAQAAGAATEFVRLTSALCEAWASNEVPVLRSGGLGVRELKRLAAQLETTEADTAVLVETAHAAGLIDDDGELTPRWAPTEEFDTWQSLPLPRRWVRLATAWLDSSRVPHLVGTRDERGAARNALGADLTRASAWRIRREALEILGTAHGAMTPDDVLAVAAWHHPRQESQDQRDLTRAALREAALLGLVAGEALADFARPLLASNPVTDDDLATCAKQLAATLPEPVNHVLLQADLTAIAPGPLTETLAADLELAADVESRGGATVYRFTPSSVRRALDAGRSGDDLLTWLREHSRTPVPQPLEYLITDAARRHGQIRVGSASAYIRSDDEAALSAVLVERRAAHLHLRRLAPTVLIARADPAEVLSTLRTIGLAPAAESADGVVVVTKSAGYRAGARRRPSLHRFRPAVLPDDALLVAVATMRRGEQPPLSAGELPPPPPADPPTSPVEIAVLIAQLRQAAETRSPVWLGYVESDGTTLQILVEPIEVDGGRVSAFDRAVARVRTFPISRISAVTSTAR